MIRNIVFDIGGVCQAFDYHSFFVEKGFSPEMVKRIEKASTENEVWQLGDIGEKTEEEMLTLFQQQDMEIADEIAKAFENLQGITIEFPETVPWIQELKAKGYMVYYLSNYPSKIAREGADQMKFLDFMDGGIFSYKVHQIKPDKEIYQTLLATYGLKAEECLFIDDRLENLEAAKKLGFSVIQFTNHTEVKQKMKELGI